MSIEHKLLQPGEQHVVANWLVATVPELDNISVTFADIGKQAWVQGVGHYTLANSDPITWEVASPSVTSFSYTTGTKLLEIGLSTGSILSVTLDGQTAAQVAALIAAHAAASDPHGDRAFATAADTALLGTVNTSLGLKADKSTTISGTSGRITGGGSLSTDRALDLAAIITGATAGGADSSLTLTYDVYGRITNVTVTSITIAQSQVTGLATALSGKEATLPNTVTAGTYGSATQVPVLTYSAKGILTGVTTAGISAPTTFAANVFRLQDNGNATKQLAWEVSAIGAGTTRTWTAPNVDINFGNLSSVATTDSNVLSGIRTRILGGTSNTVSGTDNATVNCTGAVIGGSATKVTAINCTTVNVTQALTRAFLAGCKNVSITPESPSNDGLVALGVAFKKDIFFEFPQWAGHTLLGTEDGIRSYITVLGSNTAAGNVDLSSSTGVKPLAALGNLHYRRGIQHIIHLVGQDLSLSPTKVVTVAYKVVGSVTSSGYSLGAVQTIEALFNAVGTPATPTVTISITATDKLNINVASADAMIWAAHVESYIA